MSFAILDTNVYIDHWERGENFAVLSSVRRAYIVRHSAVVLSELRRGVRTARGHKLVEALRRTARVVWAPTEEDWWQAGVLVAKLGNRHGWEAPKRRDFQNDTLIALTARRHGAAVITSNASDFHLLANELSIRVVALDD